MPMYKYYGLFSHDEDGVSVSFPDLKGCLTCGDDLKEAIEMAQDALGGYLLVSEMDDNDDIPAPSLAKDIQVPEGNSLIFVEVNTDDLRKASYKEYIEVINGREVKVVEAREKVGKAWVTSKTYGEPNLDVWAKKLIQVNEDMKAGRYAKDKS